LEVFPSIKEGYLKSQISSHHLKLAQAIYKDACAKCAVELSRRDLNTLRSRFEDEGMSFLTITLPDFCQDFEKSLDQGFVAPNLFIRFKKSKRIPAFLQGFLGRIFDRETGRIYDYDESISSTHRPAVNTADLVASVRQICLAFKKIKHSCSPEREKKAIRGFVENEHAFNVFPLPREDDILFKDVSFVLWNRIIRDIRVDMLVPKHGPGQTAEYISGNGKYVWRFWFDRLEPYFPFIDTAYPQSIGETHERISSCGLIPISTSEIGIGPISKELDRVTIIHSDNPLPARLAAVPKTLKGPRLIAIEPCCLQYAQQAILRELVSRLESSSLTKGHINFSDQEVNSSLALSSSRTGRFATIDLKDASDRVPVGYALHMFQSNRDLLDAIEACRSDRVSLPDGTVVHLRKFASMGSALCFPVEAMYFYTICVAALIRIRNLPVNRRSAYQVTRDIYIYGDDILVPADEAAAVLEWLQKYNCKPNPRKTFYSGKFRESCGVDAFNGQEVTPVYINRDRPRNRRQVKEILSCLAAGNHFYKRGFYHTAALLYHYVESVIGRLPSVREDSPALGRHHHWTFDPPKRWNKLLQRSEVLCWVQSPVYRIDKLEGYAALVKSLLKLRDLDDLAAPRDALHLERTALHGKVAIKRRWVPASFMAGLG
jgi:hypothetical protein